MSLLLLNHILQWSRLLSPACWFGPVQTLSSYTVWASGPGANLICFSTHTKSVREIAPDCISMTPHGEMWASVFDTSVERVAPLLHNWWPTRTLRVRAPCRDEVSRSLNELELDTWLRTEAHAQCIVSPSSPANWVKSLCRFSTGNGCNTFFALKCLLHVSLGVILFKESFQDILCICSIKFFDKSVQIINICSFWSPASVSYIHRWWSHICHWALVVFCLSKKKKDFFFRGIGQKLSGDASFVCTYYTPVAVRMLWDSVLLGKESCYVI